MKGGHQFYAMPVTPHSACSTYGLSSLDKALEGGRTKRDNHLGPNERELAPQKRFAGVNFVALGSPISRRPALHDVRNLDVFAFHTDCFDNLIK